MITALGYRAVTYNVMIGLLKKSFQNKEKSTREIMNELKINTDATIHNAMKLDKQVVSDKVLTGLMKCIGFDGKVVWKEGIRYYLISDKK